MIRAADDVEVPVAIDVDCQLVAARDVHEEELAVFEQVSLVGAHAKFGCLQRGCGA